MNDLSKEELHEAIRFAKLSKQHRKALHFQKALYFQSKKYTFEKVTLTSKQRMRAERKRKTKTFKSDS